MIQACFHVEASATVGLGHLRRCLTLAKELSERGARCEFDVQNKIAQTLVGEDGFELRSSADRCFSDVVVVDTKTRRPNPRTLRRFGRVLVLVDDMGAPRLSPDVLINPNIYGDIMDYSGLTGTKILAGPKYSLIHPRFRAVREDRIKESALDRIVVAFGGMDDGRYALPVMESLKSSPLPIDMVLSPLSSNKRVRVLPPRVTVHEGADLSILFRKAAVFIGGAGTAASEAAAGGVPAVLCRIDPDQDLSIHAFAAAGIQTVEAFDPEAIARKAELILSRREVESTTLLELLDGRGAARCAETIHEIAKVKVSEP